MTRRQGLLLDNTLRLNAAVFHTSTWLPGRVLSLGRIHVSSRRTGRDGEGLEVEALWAPTRELELGASIAYNDTKSDEYLGATCDNYQLANGLCPNDPVPGSQDLSGKRLSPRRSWSVNATAQYTYDIAAPRSTGSFAASTHPVTDLLAPGGRERRPVAKNRFYGLATPASACAPIKLGPHAVGQEPDRRGLLHEVSRQPSAPSRTGDRAHRHGKSYGVNLSYSF